MPTLTGVEARRREQAQVLRPEVPGARVEVGRVPPPEDLRWCVDYAWSVRWDTPAPYRQAVVPRPAVHVSAERWEGQPRLVVTGVPSRLFHRVLEGQGRAIAVAFRPAGFRPFTDRPARALVDRAGPYPDLLGGPPDADLAARLLAPDQDVADACADLFAWFAERAPAPDPRADELSGLVEAIERDTSIRSAEQAAALAGVSLRTLQRRFRDYVGPSPKWVVQRYRLLDVVEAAHTATEVDWAELAAELGYSDQSHLIRHFRTLVGRPPASYARATADT